MDNSDWSAGGIHVSHFDNSRPTYICIVERVFLNALFEALKYIKLNQNGLEFNCWVKINCFI